MPTTVCDSASSMAAVTSVSGIRAATWAGSTPAQVRAWGQRLETPGRPDGQLYLGLLAWTRLHGLISLELGQHLAATGVDPALLYEAEVAALARLGFPEARPAGVLS